MPVTRQPPRRIEGPSAEIQEIRKLSVIAEGLRADVANLHGRLDVIEALLKQSVEHRGETGSSPDLAAHYSG